jgi:hypothetical protein
MWRETSTFRRVAITGGARMFQIRLGLHRTLPHAVIPSFSNAEMAPVDGTPLPSPASGAVFRRLPEGGVLFSTETEVYFGVGVVGAHIWELLPPATRTVEEMVAILGAKYNDVPIKQIRVDVEQFLAELLSNGLVAHRETHRPGDQPLP